MGRPPTQPLHTRKGLLGPFRANSAHLATRGRCVGGVSARFLGVRSCAGSFFLSVQVSMLILFRAVSESLPEFSRPDGFSVFSCLNTFFDKWIHVSMVCYIG